MKLRTLFLIIAYPEAPNYSIYSDLVEEFVSNGHYVTVITPLERKFNRKTFFEATSNLSTLRIRTGNFQKTTNWIEKVLTPYFFKFQVKWCLKKYLNKFDYDLILFATPPPSFSRIVTMLKKHYIGSKSYLLLKDIFPANAVDLGLIKERSFIHRFFRLEEKSMYENADYIGCMSPANKEYIIRENPEIYKEKIEVCPNSIKVRNFKSQNIAELRRIFGVPNNKTICIYGGNFGVPQGIEFLIEIIKYNKKNENVFFIIIGSGTQFLKVSEQVQDIKNIKVCDYLPRKEYEKLVSISDIGLIFLNPNFTIPNFPSRLLNYLEYSLPVICATDTNTDIGSILEENGCGYGVENGDLNGFQERLEVLIQNAELRKNMGSNARELLNNNYTTAISYKTIMSHFL